MDLEFRFEHIDDWFFLVPELDPTGKGASTFTKNRAGKHFMRPAFIPAQLKDYFEGKGIRFFPHAQGKYPPGFGAPATEKNREIMQNYIAVMREISMAQAMDTAKLAWKKSFKEFLDRIYFHDDETKFAELEEVLQFCQTLCKMLAPDNIEDNPRSWIEEAIIKRNKREARFKKYIPKKCPTIGCGGRFELVDRIGKVFSFKCDICNTVIKRRLVKRRKHTQENIGKTHTHNFVPNFYKDERTGKTYQYCKCHKYICSDPSCGAKSNRKDSE